MFYHRYRYQALRGKKLVQDCVGQILLSVLALLSLLGTVFSTMPVPALAATTTTDNQVIVQLVAGIDITAINSSYNTSTVRHLAGNQIYLLAAPAGESADSLVARLQGDSRLVFVEANYKASLTESSQIFIYQDQQATLQATPSPNKQWAFDQIKLVQAQQLSMGNGITIALVDSGVNSSHIDLKDHLLPGYNFLLNSNDISDSTGHGTFVAGILALVAPQAKILPVVAIDNSGYGTVFAAAQSIDYAADQGARIINVSLGLYTPSKTLLAAVQYAQAKGALVIASVGNQNSSQPRYPAAYTRVIGVAATDQQNHKASFSNYGSDVRLSAPGVSLYSTFWKGGYGYGDGTSFATPQVAGEAALVWALYPGWDANKVSNQLEQNVTSLVNTDPTYGPRLGRGLINAYQACLNR